MLPFGQVSGPTWTPIQVQLRNVPHGLRGGPVQVSFHDLLPAHDDHPDSFNLDVPPHLHRALHCRLSVSQFSQHLLLV